MDEATPESADCNHCKGKGQLWLHLNPGGWGWFPCYICDGAGTLSGEKLLAVRAGQRITARRRAKVPKLQPGEEAERIGVKDTEYTLAELGKLPLARILEIEALA